MVSIRSEIDRLERQLADILEANRGRRELDGTNSPLLPAQQRDADRIKRDINSLKAQYDRENPMVRYLTPWQEVNNDSHARDALRQWNSGGFFDLPPQNGNEYTSILPEPARPHLARGNWRHFSSEYLRRLKRELEQGYFCQNLENAVLIEDIRRLEREICERETIQGEFSRVTATEVEHRRMRRPFSPNLVINQGRQIGRRRGHETFITAMNEQIRRATDRAIIDQAVYGRSAVEVVMDEASQIPMMRNLTMEELEEIYPRRAEETRGNNMDDASTVRTMQIPPDMMQAIDTWAQFVPVPAVEPEMVEAIARRVDEAGVLQPTPPKKIPREKAIKVKAVISAEVSEGTSLAALKASGYAMLNTWIEQGILKPDSKKIEIEEFTARQKKAIMAITVIADDYNLTDDDIIAEDFIRKAREKYPCFMVAVGDVKEVIEAKKKGIADAKKAAILAAGSGFEQSMLKGFMTMQTPVVHPADEIKVRINEQEGSMRESMKNATYNYQEYLKYLKYSEEAYAEKRKFEITYEALKDQPGVDLFEDVKAFCLKADGTNFPFRFKYGYRLSDSEFHFFFAKPSFTYKNGDNGLSMVIPDLDLRMKVTRSGSAWRFDFTVHRPDCLASMIRTETDIFPESYIKYFHAHVNTDGGICLGNAGDMIAKMRTKFDKIGDSMMILDSLLKTYNPGSPYIDMTRLNRTYGLVLHRMVYREYPDSTYQIECQKKVISGETSIQDYIKHYGEKLMQIYTFRTMQLLNRTDAVVNVDDFCNHMKAIERKISREKYLVEGMEPAFKAIETEKYFMHYMEKYFYMANLITQWKTRLVQSRLELANAPLNAETADNFLDFMQLHFNHYNNFVEVMIKNNELYFEMNPKENLCNDALGGKTYLEWFTTVRKK